MNSPDPVDPVPHALPASIVRGDHSIWRYRDAIPVSPDAIVSVGEGLTPLVDGPSGLLLKCDHISPSGSFKDRGASALVSGLNQSGVTEFFLDSSGNAGAAMALYAAVSGIACEVMVPNDTPAAKTRQAEAHGAKVTRVAGDREAVARAARQRAEAGEVYASHNWNPLFVHGTKTIAFELLEWSEGPLPDHVVLPVGYGSSLLGCHLGFSELLRNGAIATLPRLHAGQAAACAPLHQAFVGGLTDTEAITSPETTVASAVAAANPVRGAAMLAALRGTNGHTVAVDDGQILAAQDQLGKAGFYVEPSGAVGFAAALELQSGGVIGPDEAAVVLLTGSGLKG